jgi:uncharacterized protein (TIGR00255 family)
MTGYGRSEGAMGGNRLGVEIRSVNHKFCEIAVRLPKPLLTYETQIKKRLQKRFARGRFDVLVTLNGASEQSKHLEVDLGLARQYRRILRELQDKLKVQGDLDLALFTNFRDIITVTEEPKGSKRLGILLGRLLDQAMNRLDRMRRREGLALSRDLMKRLRQITRSIEVIKQRAPEVVTDYQQRLDNRIRQLAHGTSLDSQRLEQEVALYASRCDVNEELTRLESHLTQFVAMMHPSKAGNEAVGRSLDFLLQEMHREINTVGSKANDALISREVVLIKSELEKIREQVQNVE